MRRKRCGSPTCCLAYLTHRIALRRTCRVCGGTGKPGGVGSRAGDAIYQDRCESYLGTGFRGRLAVYEIMLMTDDLRRLTAQSADAVALYDAARLHGFRTMRKDTEEKRPAPGSRRWKRSSGSSIEP